MNRKTLSNCQEAFRQGRWTQSLCEDAWALLTKADTAEIACLAFDIQHCLAGLQVQHIQALDAWQDKQADRHWPLFWRLLSAEVHTGHTQKAKARLQELNGKKLSLLQQASLHHHPLALNACAQMQAGILGPWSRKKAARATRLLAKSPQLNSWVQSETRQCDREAKATRIAVVGNGPSLINAGAGQHIEQADLIIRFNQVHTGESVVSDTGQRTDLWVVSPGMTLRAGKLASLNTCVSGPAPWMRRSRYWHRFAKLPLNSVSVVPLESWYALVTRLHAPPSAGLLVLDTLIRHATESVIEIHGFTIASPSSASLDYNGQHYGDRQVASSRHNWQAEALLLRDWLNAGKVVSLHS